MLAGLHLLAHNQRLIAVTSPGVTDTNPQTLELQVQIWRGMSIDEKAAIVNNL